MLNRFLKTNSVKRVPKLNSNILKFLIRKALWNQKKGTWKALSQQDDKRRETTAEGPPQDTIKILQHRKKLYQRKRGLEKEEIIIFNCGGGKTEFWGWGLLHNHISLDDRNGKWFSMSELVTEHYQHQQSTVCQKQKWYWHPE